MDIAIAWLTLTLGGLMDVSWKVSIVNIEAYIPSMKGYNAICEAIPILKKCTYLFCYDLTLQNESGKRVKVLLSPVYSSIQQGKLRIGTSIEVRRISKMKVFEQFLVVNEWNICEDFNGMKMSGWLQLEGYTKKNRS